mmetsp:Transcript_6241/g.14220  ORF Transcript_6241/g.14220 Transcript_6241/m.14220 type:complete len:112 (-) Transcript_6241:104-439(-)
MAARRPVLPAVLALGVLTLAALNCLSPGAFVPPPAASTQKVTSVAGPALGSEVRAETVALGAAAGLLTTQPAHAGVLFDEIVPYALTTSGTILWGIVLGFVLLRLQEAFPE